MENQNLHWKFFEQSELSADLAALLRDHVTFDIEENPGIKHQVIYREFKGENYVIKRYTNLDKKGFDKKVELTFKSHFD